MASYWKSPYKEKRHTVTCSQNINNTTTLEAFLPLGRRSYNGLKQVRYSGPVSPQDWFSWALGVDNSSLKSHSSNSQHTANAKIKGILKTSEEIDGSDVGKALPDSESVVSVVSRDSKRSKREKKRVTFGDNDKDNEFAYKSPSLRRRDVIISSLNYKPLNLFGKDDLGSHIPAAIQNDRRNFSTLGWSGANKSPWPSPGTTSKSRTGASALDLPSICGSSIENTIDGNESRSKSPTHIFENNLSEIKFRNLCKHSEELRCASCVPPTEHTSTHTELLEASNANEDEHEELTFQSFQVITPPESSYVPLPDSLKMQTNNASQKSKSRRLENIKCGSDSGQEPFKRYRPQWSKTFFREQKKRHQLRLSHRKHQSIHKPLPISNDNSNAKHLTENIDMLEELSRLQISRNGKVVQEKLKTGHISQATQQNDLSECAAITYGGTSNASDEYNKRVTAQPANRLGVGFKRGKSAPSGRSHLDTSRLDKTAQILSWLNDVKSLNQFTPKKSRVNPARPMHLRQ